MVSGDEGAETGVVGVEGYAPAGEELDNLLA